MCFYLCRFRLTKFPQMDVSHYLFFYRRKQLLFYFFGAGAKTRKTFCVLRGRCHRQKDYFKMRPKNEIEKNGVGKHKTLLTFLTCICFIQVCIRLPNLYDNPC